MVHPLMSQAKRLFQQGERYALPTAWFFTDLTSVPNPVDVIKSLPSDIGVVIRDYRLKDRATYAAEIVILCQAQSRPVLIGADASLALQLNANGVHWPRWAKVKPYPGLFQSYAVHNAHELLRAKKCRADIIFLSPIFKTKSHVGERPMGLPRLRRYVRRTSIPAYALGGIDARTLRRLRGLPLAGFAGISCFL